MQALSDGSDTTRQFAGDRRRGASAASTSTDKSKGYRAERLELASSFGMTAGRFNKSVRTIASSFARIELEKGCAQHRGLMA